MPYSVDKPEDLPANVQKLPAKLIAQWVAVWNSAFSACTDDGGKKADCETSAFKQANGVIKKAQDTSTGGNMQSSAVLDFLKRALQPLVDLIANLERTIKDVDSWDGSASRWDDAKSYCAACLINANPAAGKTDSADWDKGHCMLPVREPGDSASTYVRQAVYAAAGGHGITNVKKPSDVDQADWDKLVKKAANELISAYDEAGHDCPDSIYELAGKTPPKRTRSTDISAVFGQLDQEAWETGGWLMSLFLDENNNNSLFGIMASEGKLFKADVVYDATEGKYHFGDMTQVVQDFPPVAGGETIPAATSTRTRIKVMRQADGKYRWFAAPACTAVLNRVGELDTRALFDSFIQHALDTGEYPVYQFMHLGEDVPETRMGVADWLGRDDYVYMASGLFDDSPIAQAARVALEKDPDYWGCSIGYYSTQEPDMVTVAPGLRVATFDEGVNTDITLCPEHMAASLFTAQTSPLEVKRTMNKQIEEALKKLTEGNPELLTTLTEKIDATNRTVAEDPSIIKRITAQDAAPVADPAPVAPVVEPTAPAPAENPVSDAAPADAKPTQFIADDAFVGEVTRSVLGSETFNAALSEAVTVSTSKIIERVQTELLAPLTAQVEALSQAITAAQDKVEARVKALEVPEEQRKQNYLNDLPAKHEVQVTYRPRSQAAPVNPKKTPLADQANATLEAMRANKPAQ
jgi:hypothetical protein